MKCPKCELDMYDAMYRELYPARPAFMQAGIDFHRSIEKVGHKHRTIGRKRLLALKGDCGTSLTDAYRVLSPRDYCEVINRTRGHRKVIVRNTA